MYRGDPKALETLSGRRVLIGVGGGIAAFKVAGLVSTLAQAKVEVHVAMTPAATRFVMPLTFEALSGRAVHVDPWTQADRADPQHIRLARSIDAAIVAPCTMDLLARLVHGFTDDPVTLVLSAVDRSRVPVLLAPSMNEIMWNQPATRRNVETARTDGFRVVAPGEGWQACRTVGAGRLPEPDDLVEALAESLSRR
jgi:phosphopantothenoylcysteine synthetase/decarboxylase